MTGTTLAIESGEVSLSFELQPARFTVAIKVEAANRYLIAILTLFSVSMSIHAGNSASRRSVSVLAGRSYLGQQPGVMC